MLRNEGHELNDTPPDSNYKSSSKRVHSSPNMADIADLEDIDPQVLFDQLPELPEQTDRKSNLQSTQKTGVAQRLDSLPMSARSDRPMNYHADNKPKLMGYNNLRAEMEQL